VLCFDPRGAGLTRSDSLRFTLADIADDLAACLQDAQVEKTHVVGISMGGMIAQEFALAWPERVRSLQLSVTMCGHGGGELPGWSTVGELVTGMARVPRAKSLDEVVDLFGDLLFGPHFPHADRLRFFQMRREARPGPVQNTLAQLLAIRRFSTWDRLPSVQAPTLVLGARDDRLMPPVNSAILWARIPHARRVTHPAGHCAFFEVADTFVGDVVRFSRGSEPAR
jgi:3-oxoadipate enol-lactonase